MAALFLDSSALVKRYVDEPGSARVLRLADASAGNQIYIAHTTIVEVTAAIARRAREGSITSVEADALRRLFLFDSTTEYQLTALTKEVVDRAVILTGCHSLRAADAIQLATALNIHDDRTAQGITPLVMVCSDQSLLNAAAAEGLAIEDPATQGP